MRSTMLNNFLEKQFEEAMALTREFDRIKLIPIALEPGPPDRYLAVLHCRGLVLDQAGKVTVATLFECGIHFSDDYLHRADPFELFFWNTPSTYHPNISAPLICTGKMAGGTGIRELIHQVHEIVTYQRLTMKENDAMNPAACQWARRNQHLFPIDSRPLSRRPLDLHVEPIDHEGEVS